MSLFYDLLTRIVHSVLRDGSIYDVLVHYNSSVHIFLDDVVHETKQAIEDKDMHDFHIRFLYNPLLHHHFGWQYLVDILKEFFVAEKVLTGLA